MSSPSTDTIEVAFRNTFAAHSAYETITLGGVYDEAWADWYANHLLAHDLPVALPDAARLTVAELSAILRQLHHEYTREAPDIDWQRWYAERLPGLVTRAEAAG